MTKRRIPIKLQRLVRRRALGYCEYCICPEFCATQKHSFDHIDPESQGGPTAAENLALTCQGCNNAKYNKTHATDPLSRRLVALFHPRLHDWDEHFAWSPDLNPEPGTWLFSSSLPSPPTKLSIRRASRRVARRES